MKAFLTAVLILESLLTFGQVDSTENKANEQAIRDKIKVDPIVHESPTGDTAGTAFFEALKGKLMPLTQKWTSVEPSPNKDNGSDSFEHRLRITSEANAQVVSVADGRVTAVIETNDINAILVRHGRYIVAYSQVRLSDVKMGDNVFQGQFIGKPNLEGNKSFIDLEVWNGPNKAKTKDWLVKK